MRWTAAVTRMSRESHTASTSCQQPTGKQFRRSQPQWKQRARNRGNIRAASGQRHIVMVRVWRCGKWLCTSGGQTAVFRQLLNTVHCASSIVRHMEVIHMQSWRHYQRHFYCSQIRLPRTVFVKTSADWTGCAFRSVVCGCYWQYIVLCAALPICHLCFL